MWKYILIMLFAVSVGLMSPAGADGIIIVDPPPGVDVRLDQSLAIKYHHVDIQIKDQVVTTRDRKSTRLNSSHVQPSRMPSSA